MTDALAIRPGPARRPPRLTFFAPGEASVTLHPSSCMASAGRTNNPWLGWPVLCPVVGAVVTGLTTHDRISNTFGLRPIGNPVTCMGSTPQTSTGTRCCPRRAWSACRCGGDVSQWHQTPGRERPWPFFPTASIDLHLGAGPGKSESVRQAVKDCCENLDGSHCHYGTRRGRFGHLGPGAEIANHNAILHNMYRGSNPTDSGSPTIMGESDSCNQSRRRRSIRGETTETF